ncbi:MAG: class I SAM-dependent methyltransferase [Anaerolineaceae bacterium]|jgi:SAM-dependent methyltransferase
MNILDHNRLAWNHEVQTGNIYTIPVTKNEMTAAFKGEYKIILTPTKPVPADWLGDIRGKQVLCLASGGGQQGPILAAAGAEVTVFDNSDEQLKRDSQMAEEYHLSLKVVRGNMQDLGCFPDGSFDLIVHPVSNCFIDDILPVWKECYRVLRSPGRLLSGFNNPLTYAIDLEEARKSGRCEIKNALPYSDLKSLPPQEIQRYIDENIPLEFGHTLADQIGGQIAAGFLIAGFYEDKGEELLDAYVDSYIATKAIKVEITKAYEV